jgi:hypothetical protein
MIAALLSALRVFDNKAPPFGASIVIEVFGRQPQDDGQSVATETTLRIGYLKHTDSQQIEYLRLSVCNQQVNDQPACSLAEFFTAIEDLQMSLDQWNRECYQL